MQNVPEIDLYALQAEARRLQAQALAEMFKTASARIRARLNRPAQPEAA